MQRKASDCQALPWRITIVPRPGAVPSTCGRWLERKVDEVGRPAGLLVPLIIGAAPAWRLGFGEPSGDPSFFYEEPERGCSSRPAPLAHPSYDRDSIRSMATVRPAVRAVKARRLPEQTNRWKAGLSRRPSPPRGEATSPRARPRLRRPSSGHRRRGRDPELPPRAQRIRAPLRARPRAEPRLPRGGAWRAR